MAPGSPHHQSPSCCDNQSNAWMVYLVTETITEDIGKTKDGAMQAAEAFRGERRREDEVFSGACRAWRRRLPVRAAQQTPAPLRLLLVPVAALSAAALILSVLAKQAARGVYRQVVVWLGAARGGGSLARTPPSATASASLDSRDPLLLLLFLLSSLSSGAQRTVLSPAMCT